MLKRLVASTQHSLQPASPCLYSFWSLLPKSKPSKKAVKLRRRHVASTLYVMAGALADVFNRKNKGLLTERHPGRGKSNRTGRGGQVRHRLQLHVLRGERHCGQKAIQEKVPEPQGHGMALHVRRTFHGGARNWSPKGLTRSRISCKRNPGPESPSGRKGRVPTTSRTYLLKEYGTSTAALKKAACRSASAEAAP